MNTVALQTEDLPHYKYDDYVQWEGRWELIRGIPYAMVPAPLVKHQVICSNIILYLGELLKKCPKCRVILPVDWQVAEDTVVQPDVLVVCGDNIGIEKLTVTPVMVFEVLSPSTERKDRVLKYQLYENAGVKYYCIVDPENSSVTVFVLQKERFSQTGDFEDGLMPFDFGPCRVEIDFRDIFY
ncbi:MAG: Uma2 family endonuclease [Candidatus Aminicenantes bacterium]|nr:Uma2 family endonuclease [Candidatus Aminicenantes bacterium]